MLLALRRRTHWVVIVVGCLALLGGYAYQRSAEWGTAIQVSIVGMQPGNVRLEQGLWVTRQPDGEFVVFQDRSDFYADRSLRWVSAEAQFEEPISSARYTIGGAGWFGPAGELYRVKSRLQGERLLILPARIVAGGPGDPAWLSNLKAWVWRVLHGRPSPRL